MRIMVVATALAVIILAGFGVNLYARQHASQLAVAYAASDAAASAVSSGLATANSEFGFKVFKELYGEDADENVFISPFSISTALAMVYNGAEGTTKDAMARTLEFSGMVLEKLNQDYANLVASLENADEKIKLNVANSIWARQEFASAVKPEFVQRLKDSYDSELFTRDFTQSATVDEINDWIKGKTEGKIGNMLERIEPQHVMFLINAIYFKGEWTTQFDESETKEADFFLADGRTTRVNMMSVKGNFSYYESGTYELVRLPYGRDKVAMYIFLPKEDSSLEALLASLNSTLLNQSIGKLHAYTDFTVKMPRFKVEYGTKRLNYALKRLGMSVAFDPLYANLKGIADVSPRNLYIDFVDHRAVIEVNEKGTEAAAATIVSTSISAIRPHQFIADRPFFYIIRDDRSGTILFMGTVVNPPKV